MVPFYPRVFGWTLAGALALGLPDAHAAPPGASQRADIPVDTGGGAPVTIVSDVHEFVIQHDGSLDEHDDSTLPDRD